MKEWELLTCIHGIKEELDYHSCTLCQEIAEALGYDLKNNNAYIFTEENIRELKKDIKKRSKLKTFGIS